MHLWSLLTFDSWKLSNKKNLIFFPISNQLTLCQLLYSIEHSTDFRVFFSSLSPVECMLFVWALQCYFVSILHIDRFYLLWMNDDGKRFCSIDISFTFDYRYCAHIFYIVPSSDVYMNVFHCMNKILNYFILSFSVLLFCFGVLETNRKKNACVLFFLLLWNTWK